MVEVVNLYHRRINCGCMHCHSSLVGSTHACQIINLKNAKFEEYSPILFFSPCEYMFFETPISLKFGFFLLKKNSNLASRLRNTFLWL